MLMWLLGLNSTGKANTHASTFLFQGMSLNNLEFHTKMLFQSSEVDVNRCSPWSQIFYLDSWYRLKHTKETRWHTPSYLYKAAVLPLLVRETHHHNQPLCLRLTASFADLFCLIWTCEIGLEARSDNLRNGPPYPETVPPFCLMAGLSPTVSHTLAEELRQIWLHAPSTVSEGNLDKCRAVPQTTLAIRLEMLLKEYHWRALGWDGEGDWACCHGSVSGELCVCLCVCVGVSVLLMWICCMCKHTAFYSASSFSALWARREEQHVFPFTKRFCFSQYDSVLAYWNNSAHSNAKKRVLQKLDGACKSE